MFVRNSCSFLRFQNSVCRLGWNEFRLRESRIFVAVVFTWRLPSSEPLDRQLSPLSCRHACARAHDDWKIGNAKNVKNKRLRLQKRRKTNRIDTFVPQDETQTVEIVLFLSPLCYYVLFMFVLLVVVSVIMSSALGMIVPVVMSVILLVVVPVVVSVVFLVVVTMVMSLILFVVVPVVVTTTLGMIVPMIMIIMLLVVVSVLVTIVLLVLVSVVVSSAFGMVMVMFMVLCVILVVVPTVVWYPKQELRFPMETK